VRRAARPLLYLGIVAAVVGLSKVHAAYIANPPYSYHGTFRFGWSIVYILMLGVTAYGVGLPDLPRSPRSALVTSVAAAGGAAVLISVFQLFIGDALLPRFVVFGAAILLVPWYLICVAVATDGGARAAGRDRVLLVSDTANGTELRTEITRSAERPVRLVGILGVAPSEATGAGDRPLVEQARADHVTVLVLDREAQASPSIVAQAAILHQEGVRIRTMSLFYEQWLGMLPVSELERVSLLFDIGEVHRGRYGRMKRLVDLTISLLALPVVLLVAAFVCIGNLVANRGSLFYVQPRVGKNGESFRIYKFRTMRDAPAAAPSSSWTSLDDPRVTPFGRFLRRSHLDELPQVLNILKGDLAVVGPRPEQPHYVEELREKLPFYDVRHLVRPGLTGWAQVKYGYAGDESDAMEKLQYEFYYLRHQSLGLDGRIVGRTVRSVLGGRGR
jgi:lipopolysaccharide/colanic/teichoic acid biosynthesis glycosyltransferase